MKTYTEFHGQIPPQDIGRRLRDIVKKEKTSFKIMTGYGASSGQSNSKKAALSSLRNMKKQGLISAYLPGEVKHHLLKESSSYYPTKMLYETQIRDDKDYGNDGIIYVFI